MRVASAATQEMLLDLFPEALRYEDAMQWNAAAERVEATERLLYEDLVLEETRAPAPGSGGDRGGARDEALARGPRAFSAGGRARPRSSRGSASQRARATRARAAVRRGPRRGAARAVRRQRSFAELREADVPGALLARLDPTSARRGSSGSRPSG